MQGNFFKAVFTALSSIIFVSVAQPVYAVPTDACYAGSDLSNSTTYIRDRTNGNSAINIGAWGAQANDASVEAFAKSPVTGILYGSDQDNLGRINLDNGSFTNIGNYGTVSGGLLGLVTITLNVVNSLSFDPTTGILWGVHIRAPGLLDNGEDLLFQINPATGAVIRDAFGIGNDYLPLNTNTAPIDRTDVDDIAFDVTGQLYASVNNGGSGDRFIRIDKTNGNLTLVGDFGVTDVEGLTADQNGNVIATTGQNGAAATNNSLWDINLITGAAGNQRVIGVGGDYEAVECYFNDVDLELSKTVNNLTPAPGEQITYTVTVTNTNLISLTSGVEITDPPPAGLTFVSSSNTKAGSTYNSTTGVWSIGVIPANTSYQLNITYQVNLGTGGQTIPNIAQITFSDNPDPDSTPNNNVANEDDQDAVNIVSTSAALTVDDVTVVEGVGMLYTVTLGNAVAGGFTVDIGFTDGVATGGAAPLASPEDYANDAVTLNFAGTAGEMQQFTVATLDDALLEGSETYTVSLTASNAAVDDSDTALGTITDNDAATLTIEDVTAAEGDGLTFTVTLNNAVQGGLSVTTGYTDSTATGGTDYDNTAQVLNFSGSAGEVQPFTVNSIEDLILEGDETFTVNLTASNASIDDTDTAIGTITNDDAPSAPVITKAFNSSAIAPGGTSTITFTIDNNANVVLQTGITFTDAYPAGLVNATPLNVGGTCANVTTTATAGGNNFNVTAGDVPANSSCTITVDVTAPQAGTYDNITSGVSTDQQPAAGAPSNTATLTVAVSFSINDVTQVEGDAGTTAFTFTVSLDGGATSINTISFLYNTADGTATANVDYVPVVGGIGVILAGQNSTTIDIDVIGEQLEEVDETFFVNLITNSVNATVGDGQGVGTIVNDDTDPVANDDSAANPAPVGPGNPTTIPAIHNNDTDADGTVVVGTIDLDPATAGQQTTLANGDGTWTVNTTSGDATFTPNVGLTGNPAPIPYTIEDNHGNVSNEAILSVTYSDAPTVAKGFSPSSIAPAGTSTLTITLGNSNATAATLTANLVDTLPSGVSVANISNLSDNCPGTASATSGGNTVTYPNGAAIPPGGCSITVDVTSSTPGTHTNTIAAGDLQTDRGSNPNAANATLSVNAPSAVTITKAFSPSTIVVGDVSTITFTIDNSSNAIAQTGISFTDSYPAGLINATPLNVGGSCANVTTTATAGGNSFDITAGDVAANNTCTITVDVMAAASGTYNNTTSGVSTDQQPTAGVPSNTATLTVNDTPTISIDDVTQMEGDTGTTNFVFTVSISAADLNNPITVDFATADSTATLANIDYVINTGTLIFPAGTSTLTQTITVIVNGDTTLEPDETFTVNLSNASSNATIADNQGLGTIQNDDAAAVTVEDVTVVEGVGLQFTVTLNNAVAGGFTVDASFTDVSASGGNVDYDSATQTLSFAGTAGETQTFTVASIDDAILENTETFTVNLAADNANVDATDTATGTITDNDVPSAPAITKAFSSSTIAPNGTSTITFTIDNSGNATAQTGITFTDAYPAGLVNTTPLNVGGSCSNVSTTATAGGNNFNVTAGDVAASSSCTITVDVTAAASGNYNNTTSGVSTNEQPTPGAPSNTATLTVNSSVIDALDDDFTGIPINGAAGGSAGNVLTNDTLGGVPVNSADVNITVTNDGGLTGVTIAVDGTLNVPPGTPPGNYNVTYEICEVANPTNCDIAVANVLVQGAAITVDDVSQTEGGDLVFTITLDNAVAAGFTVDVSFTDVTATGGNTDYDSTTQTINFAGNAGETVQVTVPSTDDALAEGNETFTVNLTSSDPNVDDSDTGTGTIIDNDQDTDNDGPTDSDEGNGDRDGDGIPNFQDFDPTGYFYCEDNGQIIPGGNVTFMAAGAGTTTVFNDGSSGFYRVMFAGPDTFTMNITLPPGTALSPTRVVSATPIDPTGGPNPTVLGGGEVGSTGFLNDFSAAGNTPWYETFTNEAGDPFIINNNIPLTNCVGLGSPVLLTKTAEPTEVVIGDLVQYTVQVENTTAAAFTDIDLRDNIPGGFNFVDGSAIVIRAGADGQFDTNDDLIDDTIIVTGSDPIIFENIDLGATETLLVRYYLRVSSGVVEGEFTNTIQGFSNVGLALTNTANATVRVVQDPIFQRTTIIGKVFHDRDGDGWQDSAHATGIRLSGAAFGDTQREVNNLRGRVRSTDPVVEHQAIVRVPVNPSDEHSFTLTTREGTVLHVDAQGQVSEAHRSAKAKGLTAQDIRITVAHSTRPEASEAHQVVLDHVIDPVYFDSGKAVISQQTITQLRQALKDLGQKQDLRLRFIGHTDDEFLAGETAKRFVDNQGLSEARAQMVAAFVQSELGLPHDTVSVLGEGAQQPIADNATAAGRALNRRVEIAITFSEPARDPIGDDSANANEMVIIISNHGIHEDGIPGVRIANVEGLLVETDQFGRYHMADIDGGRFDRGRNFIMKVDPATLPKGAQFTTENPRVLRITQALLSKINFGVKLPEENAPKVNVVLKGEQVEGDSKAHFASGKSQLTAAQQRQLEQLIKQLQGKGNIRIQIIGHTDSEPLSSQAQNIYGDNYGLSQARSAEVKEKLMQALNLSDEAISIQGLGPDAPIASNDTEVGKAQNRRVEVQAWYEDEPDGRTIVLPHGGVVWATEDPTVLDPRLNVIAQGAVTLSKGRVKQPARFTLYSNYLAFIERWELAIYASNDRDLIRPIEVLQGDKFVFTEPVEWHAAEVNRRYFKPGESLSYVLRVYDAKGRMDETTPRALAVADERLFESSTTATVNEDERAQEVANSSFSESNLARQTIPIQGSRIRLHGVDVDPSYILKINGEKVLVDVDGKFVHEQHLPTGEHRMVVNIADGQDIDVDRELIVDVSGKYLFMVGLANLTFGENNFSGSVEPLAEDDRFDEEIFIDGRVAFYLKGKVKGKYLVTAQLDTTEDELNNLGNRLEEEDLTAVFRRLDPDRFYPVYGDDSTTTDDTDSQGAVYVRVDWDKSMALWGNYNTDLTGTEFAQYNRSLYGGKFEHRDVKITKFGEHQHEVHLFGSEAQTALAHNEFAATGGSLYFLRDTDVVQGSENVWVEVRNRDTQQVVGNITLEEGRDYDIDYIQGRIILTRPLTQVAIGSGPSIIRDTPLEGDDVFLLVDYEFRPDAFSADNITSGARGKGWLNDYIAIGGTYVNEERDGVDYELKGTDVTLQAGKGTYLKLEYAESDSQQADNSFFSTNGGINFSAQNTRAADSDGNAVGIEARVNLAEVSDQEGYLMAWWKDRDAGFSSTARLDDGIETTDSGVEGQWQATEKLELAAQATRLDREGVEELTVISIQGDYHVNDKFRVGAELRHEDENDDSGIGTDSEATLGGVELGYRLSEHTEIYTSGQVVLDDSGDYEDNALATVGIESQVSDKLALKAEVSAGDRGEAVVLGTEYAVTPNMNISLDAGFGSGATSQVGTNYTMANGLELYGSYAVDPDRTNGGENLYTLGTRRRFQNGLSLYSESQFGEGDQEQSVARTFGLNFDLSEQWRLSTSLQINDIDRDSGDVERQAATVGASFRSEDLKFSSALEYREDEDESLANDATQWLTTNAIEWQQSESLRWLGKADLSLTQSDTNNSDEGKFAELDLGFAYRPAFTDRLNLLGKYTFIYDLATSGQDTARADERSHVFSIEGIYDVNQKWELGAKLAYKTGNVRLMRGEGPWFNTGARLAVTRARYHLLKKWDALFEYRWLETDDSDDNRQGALLGLYRHVGKHLKIGGGYNFTNFDDDLTTNDYDAHGWFFDIVGKY